jgi:hypothetical protein
MCSDSRKGLLLVGTDVRGKILICPANRWWDAGSLELAQSCGREIVNDRGWHDRDGVGLGMVWDEVLRGGCERLDIKPDGGGGDNECVVVWVVRRGCEAR